MAIESIKYTIVTVCYNEQYKIKRTIESVVQQDYFNLEYLIIDGASNDGTLEIVQHYAQKDRRIKVISEPDDGIYNAMNKAITLAKGDYINFMNAGDSFAQTNVLNKIEKILRRKEPDILCGQAIFFASNTLFERTARFEKYRNNLQILGVNSNGKTPYIEILLGKWGCHQAIFAKTGILRQYYFNEKYKIAADYDWFVRNIKDKRNIEYVKINVCNFVGDGVSCRSENFSAVQKEWDDVIKQHYGISIFYVKQLIRLYRKSNLRKWLRKRNWRN